MRTEAFGVCFRIACFSLWNFAPIGPDLAKIMATKLSKYFGNLPAEYNRSVHGPYDPSRFYGKGKLKIHVNILTN